MSIVNVALRINKRNKQDFEEVIKSLGLNLGFAKSHDELQWIVF